MVTVTVTDYLIDQTEN